ncbi:MAG: RtcB family protein [Candidatus Lindowbacteria bacterium]|nr:RtcB family protein [Candidatus Lindowbacteria bacterium]
MKWVKDDLGTLPLKSWCDSLEDGALKQASNLASHPFVFRHVALMPDCHVGYGMPIGGVIGCDNAVIPNAVGVDIGCGMGAVRTNLPVDVAIPELIEKVLHSVKRSVPVGEGRAHSSRQAWDVLDSRDGDRPGGVDSHCWNLAYCNLGTLGGGNHFIEMQKGDDGFVWLMIHSGSRNLGYRIAEHYHKLALELNERWNAAIPDRQLAYLPADSAEGQAYICDMNFALDYARENRRRIMEAFKREMSMVFKDAAFISEVNIHHNYAALENHVGKDVWVHRKGATSAKTGETGIIPGSMGTASYIVEGLGNPESFMSCSHGAGRRMGRADACRSLSKEECDKAMEGIVFDGFKAAKGKFRRNAPKGAVYDLEEAPLAYKDIEDVIASELDLVRPVVKLRPLGVVKG